MRILLTGGTGMIGSYLVPKLLQGGHAVALLIRPTSNPWRIADWLDQVTRIEGDLDGLPSVRGAVSGFQPDAVIHLAWSGVLNRDRNSWDQIRNIPATAELLRLADELEVRHWIGLGSQAEYGPCPQAVCEAQPTRPTTRYGAAKLSACHLAEQACALAGMRFAWLRLFSSYGPRDDPSWL